MLLYFLSVCSPINDTIFFKVQAFPLDQPLTKRSIVSQIAELFNPTGLLTPVIVKAKILIQELWIQGTQWDEEAPEDIKNEWLEFSKSLYQLELI